MTFLADVPFVAVTWVAVQCHRRRSRRRLGVDTALSRQHWYHCRRR